MLNKIQYTTRPNLLLYSFKKVLKVISWCAQYLQLKEKNNSGSKSMFCLLTQWKSCRFMTFHSTRCTQLTMEHKKCWVTAAVSATRVSVNLRGRTQGSIWFTWLALACFWGWRVRGSASAGTRVLMGNLQPLKRLSKRFKSEKSSFLLSSCPKKACLYGWWTQKCRILLLLSFIKYYWEDSKTFLRS